MMHSAYTDRTVRAHRQCALPAVTLVSALTMTAMLAILAVPSMAAEPFAPPQGCKLEITVQNRGCTVSQHYRCDTDQPGDQRVTIFTREGAVYQSRIDKETRWLESTNLRNGLTDTLEPTAKDHASLRALLETGRDDFDFWTVSGNGQRLHHVGHDELTSEKVDIDGVALEKTRFDLMTYSEAGDVLIHRTGQQFISRTHGRFYGGTETAEDWTGEVRQDNDTPVRFSFPGQPGFGSTQPEYDCDLQMVDLHRPDKHDANGG